LVGSTALSARMDPEDLREIISAYQKCVAETVQRFGGFVAKYMGDGVLVYFGYPHLQFRIIVNGKNRAVLMFANTRVSP
jgi:class 3 adenylate cyclase